MRINPLSFFKKATLNQNLTSFKGWKKTEESYRQGREEWWVYDKYSTRGERRPAHPGEPGAQKSVTEVTSTRCVNQHWEDEAGEAEHITMFKENVSHDTRTIKDLTIERARYLSQQLQKRADMLSREAEKYSRASIECQETAISIEENVKSKQREDLQRQIEKLQAELQKLK